jgi:ribosomal protein S18 acetylase RimI-like enzyme
MIELRYANSSDSEMLAVLGRRAFYEAFGAHNDPEDMQAYLDLAFHPDQISKQLSDPEVIYMVAYYHDEPVGYAKLKRHSSPPELSGESCMQLERIYALQAFIGKKIGKALMEECVRKSRDEGCRYLWLGVWQQNQRAIAFYRKWNFKVIGYKKFIIGKEVNDDFIMALDLQGDGSSLREM